MANRLSGKVAKVEYGGDAGTASLNNWSVDINNNMLDVTSFTTGTLQWREFIVGLSDWSGTISGFSDSSSTGLDTLRTNTLTPSTAQIILYTDKVGGENYQGSCFIEGFSVSAPIDGSVDVSINYQGTGSLTYSSAT